MLTMPLLSCPHDLSMKNEDRRNDDWDGDGHDEFDGDGDYGGGNDWDGACHTCPDSLHPAHIPHDLSSRVKVGKKREGLARGGRVIKCKGHQMETFILESKWACLGISNLSFRLPLSFSPLNWAFCFKSHCSIWPDLTTHIGQQAVSCIRKAFLSLYMFTSGKKIGPLFTQHDCIGKSGPWTKHPVLLKKGIRWKWKLFSWL